MPSQRSILVVDDREDICDLVATLLRRRGHTVQIAHDGIAALEVVVKFSPELAFIDVHMPRMDGYELARRLRSLFPTLVLVAMTASEAGTKGAKERVFDEHLLKPIDMGRLWSIVASH